MIHLTGDAWISQTDEIQIGTFCISEETPKELFKLGWPEESLWSLLKLCHCT